MSSASASSSFTLLDQSDFYLDAAGLLGVVLSATSGNPFLGRGGAHSARIDRTLVGSGVIANNHRALASDGSCTPLVAGGRAQNGCRGDRPGYSRFRHGDGRAVGTPGAA
jgi:hypothetical protein